MIDKHSLLIVDDDPLNASTLAEIFKLAQYTIDIAQSAAEALTLFAS